ncbi:MAG: PKD domain-containing protein [Chloroflexi bacterium]|nr:PKD domain-containing protein [Chloroflexota bacterium]
MTQKLAPGFLFALLLLVIASFQSPASARIPVPTNFEARTTFVSEPVTPHVINIDLRTLPVIAPWKPGDPTREIPRRVHPRSEGKAPQLVTSSPDPLLAFQKSAVPSVNSITFDTPILNFEGIPFTGVAPPDTVGEVGPNHYIQMTNGNGGTPVAIYDKSGSLLGGPFVLDSLWTGGGSCAAGHGDPIVLYDRLADRWLLSEFADSGNHLCVYVSQTSDPVTGGWYGYDFSTPDFPDYPKYAVWPDAYYVSSNESSPAVYALDRTQMLAGGVTTSQRFTAPGLAGFSFQALTPSDMDGPTPPPAGSPNYFMRHRDDEVHNVGANDPNWDYLEIWEFHVDWVTPANSSFTKALDLPISEFDSNLCGLVSFYCFPQLGTGQTLDPLREVIMWRLQYRNFNSHETLVGNLVTDVDGTDHGGIRWFELRKTGTAPWTLFQEGTYAPDAAHRWMGSIAMDQRGNIAMGYSVSDAFTIYPSIRYAGRLASDPLGTLPQGEYSIIAGTGSQIFSDRWGDYSAMSVDPADDCTFWYTNEYAPANGLWQTRIAAFRFPTCLYSWGYLTGTVYNDQTSAPIVGATVQASIPPSYTWSTTSEAGGLYHMPVILGTYTVSATAPGYFSYLSTGITVTTDSTTILNISLLPKPTYVISGRVRDVHTGSPLTATVSLSGSPISPTQTDPSTGWYSMTVPTGFHTLQAEAARYVDQSRPITLTSDRVEDFDLEPVCLLVVDDDVGASYETYYTDALDRLGRSYNTVSTPPDAKTMSHYQGVIWLTGDQDTDTLSAADQANLASYLDGGGRLFLSGQDIGFDIHATSFYSNYLYANYDSDDTITYILTGLDFLSGLDVTISGGDGANNQMHPRDVEPVNGGVAVYDYPDPHLYGGVAYQGMYRTVYFSFGYEGINNQTDRDGVMSTTLAYLRVCGVSLPCTLISGTGFDYEPLEPGAQETVHFTATVAEGGAELPITYTWNFGDGITRTLQTNTITHTFPFATTDLTYTVSLTIINGCSSQQNVQESITILSAIRTVYLSLLLRND